MSHIGTWHEPHNNCVCVWDIFLCDMSYVWREICIRTHNDCVRDTFLYVTWHTQWLCVRVRHIPMSHSLINMCAMTHSYMWHDPHQQGDCKVHSCVSQSHSYVCHDSFLYVPWLIPICKKNTMIVCACETFLCLTVSFTCVPWLIPIDDTTHAMIVCACEVHSCVSQSH